MEDAFSSTLSDSVWAQGLVIYSLRPRPDALIPAFTRLSSALVEDIFAIIVDRDS